MKLLFVGIGGFFGAASRYLLSGLVYRFFNNPYLPYGTLAVNLIGCLLIGFLGGFSENRQLFDPQVRALIFIGFIGGFTTFSTLIYELFTFARNGQILAPLLNLALHIVLGLLFLWLGFILAKPV